jgi:preprotein translocase subunit SecF
MEGGKNKLVKTYLANYRKSLFIPLIILIIAIVSIVNQYASTGDFINRDISLKGGISITIIDDSDVDIDAIESVLAQQYTPHDVSIRSLKSTGSNIGFIIESDIPELNSAQLNATLDTVSQITGKKLSQGDYSFETMGSSLGKSFFNQTIRALLIAFIFMGIVVFLYFRSLVPSTAVILSAFSDIVTTVAILNLAGIKMGTAGIAALLMLVGYSIDTDIMLTTRVLKRKENSLENAISGAFKTGMTMTLTTIVAVTVALIFAQSDVIRQIMTILLIGLSIDIINTWIQNAGLLVWYVKRKNGN